MSVVNEEDAVGYYMTVTLVNDAKLEGTVFTYNPKEGLLVLMQNITTHPSLKMIRTPFIKDYTITKKVAKESMLTPQLEPFSQLPSMHAGRDKSIFKHASVQLKHAEANRNKHLEDLAPETPIAACDAFVKVARVYPDISWDNEDMVIRVTNDVIIAGDPDWTTPKALLVDGASEKELSLVNRIQKALLNAKGSESS